MTGGKHVGLESALARASERVGHTQRVDLGLVAARDVQRFAVAADDGGAEYLDAESARVAGYEAPVAPLLYLSSVLGWQAGPAEAELLADGNARDPLGDVPLDGLRLMGGGQELTFHEPVRHGTHVTMEVVVDDVRMKQGREGPLLLIDVVRRYVDDGARILVECRETFIAR